MKKQLRRPDVHLGMDGILRITFPLGMDIQVSDLESVLARHKELAPDIKSPVLAEGERGDPFDSRIRAFFKRQDVADHNLAIAVMTSSRIGALMANIFLNVTTFPFPVRLFEDRKEAIAWLHRQQQAQTPEEIPQPAWLRDTSRLDQGKQAQNFARLYFQVRDVLDDVDTGVRPPFYSDLRQLQLRQVARNLENELRYIKQNNGIASFLRENGLDEGIVKKDLDRFNEYFH